MKSGRLLRREAADEPPPLCAGRNRDRRGAFTAAPTDAPSAWRDPSSGLKRDRVSARNRPYASQHHGPGDDRHRHQRPDPGTDLALARRRHDYAGRHQPALRAEFDPLAWNTDAVADG